MTIHHPRWRFGWCANPQSPIPNPKSEIRNPKSEIMPELPEVETMRRGIAAIAGCSIADAVRLECQRKPIRIEPRPAALSKRLIGRRVEEVGRLGKRVILK